MYKKLLLSVILAVILGSFIGHSLFLKLKEEEKEVFNYQDRVFFLLEGVYNNKEQAANATKDIATKIIVNEDSKYYVYLAITKNSDIKKRQEEYLENEKIEYSVKEMVIEDDTFISVLEQMDNLILKSSTAEEMLSINKVILANYEELVLKR